MENLKENQNKTNQCFETNCYYNDFALNQFKNDGRMNWFIEAYNDGSLHNKLVATITENMVHKGSIKIPCGGGKGSVIFENIISCINNAKDTSEKIVFNISAPILRLEAQLINDLFNVVRFCCKEESNKGEIMFFVNSSADSDDYQKSYSSIFKNDILPFNNIDEFKKSKTARFAVIASCHKSLPNFAQKITYLNKFSKSHLYIDESHTLFFDKGEDFEFDKLSDEDAARLKTLEILFAKCEYVYTFSATPLTEITKKLTGGENKHIIDISAQKLIDDGRILPPKLWYFEYDNKIQNKNDNYVISPNLCIEFMENVRYDNPNIKHKILVCCKNNQHMKYLINGLSKYGFPVYATSAEIGEHFAKNGIVQPTSDIINQVDEYDGDCFVLHIRQLIQGIDIKTLTDCILYDNGRIPNESIQARTIQTIGRTLRVKGDERCIDKDKRKKQYGNCLMPISNLNYDAIYNRTVGYLTKYYGFGSLLFNKCSSSFGGSKKGSKRIIRHGIKCIPAPIQTYIETVRMTFQQIFDDEIVPKYRCIAQIGNKNATKLCESAIDELNSNFKNYIKNHNELRDLGMDEECTTDFMYKQSELLTIFKNAIYKCDEISNKCGLINK